MSVAQGVTSNLERYANHSSENKGFNTRSPVATSNMYQELYEDTPVCRCRVTVCVLSSNDRWPGVYTDVCMR